MDDVLIYGDGERHDQGLQEILRRFSAAGLMPKANGSEFSKKEVKWLGQWRWIAGRRTNANETRGARNRARAEMTERGESPGQTDPHQPGQTRAERIEPSGRARESVRKQTRSREESRLEGIPTDEGRTGGKTRRARKGDEEDRKDTRTGKRQPGKERRTGDTPPPQPKGKPRHRTSLASHGHR